MLSTNFPRTWLAPAIRSLSHPPRLTPVRHLPTSQFHTSAPRSARQPSQEEESGYREPLDTSDWNATRAKRWTPTTAFILSIPFLTFVLGTWQVQRLKWKTALIEDLNEKMKREPMNLPRNINTEAVAEFAYRKVSVRGYFDHSKEILMQPRTREGDLGANIITPFIREDGGAPVLVNRGFIKQEMIPQSARPEGVREEMIEVVGMLRAQEERTSFSPANNPAKGQWLFMDIAEIAKATGASEVLIDNITYANGGQIGKMLRDGEPVGRGGTITLRNMHAAYVVQWYGLCLATSFMAWRLLRRPMSGAHKFAGTRG